MEMRFFVGNFFVFSFGVAFLNSGNLRGGEALIRRLFLTFNLNFYFLAMLHYVYIFTLFTVTPAIQEQACHAGRLPSLLKSAKTHTSNKVSYIHPLDKFTLPQRGNFLRAQEGGGGSSGFATLR